MNGFLRHLAVRTLGAPPEVRPSIDSRYAEGGAIRPTRAEPPNPPEPPDPLETAAELRPSSARAAAERRSSSCSAVDVRESRADRQDDDSEDAVAPTPRGRERANVSDGPPLAMRRAGGTAAGASGEIEDRQRSRTEARGGTRSASSAAAKAAEMEALSADSASIRPSVLDVETSRDLSLPAATRGVSLSSPPSPGSPPAPSHLEISIGRIEVRLTAPTPPPPFARRPAAAPGPRLTLDGYLAQRRAGEASSERGARP